jgi:putative transposase
MEDCMRTRTQSITIEVTARQREVLETLVRAKQTPQDLAERCRIVLMSAEGHTNQYQAKTLGIDRQRVRRWRYRWPEAYEVLVAAEAQDATDKDLKALVVNRLADAPRCGAPAKFAPEQVVDIIALACEPPEDSGLPVSHWTPPELANEAIKRGIVESISSRQVDRFLVKRTFGHTSPSIG